MQLTVNHYVQTKSPSIEDDLFSPSPLKEPPNPSPWLLFRPPSVQPSSPSFMPAQSQDIWDDTKHFIAYESDFFGRK
ncbi:MAG: hypothetical protein ACREOZ_00325 [Gloeomargaritales cyanobacterium]